MNHNYCVIMAGGAGTRLWPISRAHRPKQFLGVGGEGDTFVRITYDRFAEFIPADHILVVTTKRYTDLVKEELPELPDENLIVEPFGRNTAPCILYSAYTLLKRDPEAVMVATPADHSIMDHKQFQKAIIGCLKYAAKEKVLLTLGVKPTGPDVNYGYIQVSGGKAAWESGEREVKVKTFIEKPDAELAKVLVDSGEFFWNSGIFIWQADTIVSEMNRYMPEMTSLFRGWEKAVGTPTEEDFIARSYVDCMNISIDYALMEKTDNAWMYPVFFDWVDIGSWESLMEVWSRKDENGNGINSAASLLMDDKDNLIISTEKGKLVAVRGLKDFVVADTGDVLFICPKNDKCIKDFLVGISMPEYEKYK